MGKKRHLILSIIAGSALTFCAAAMAIEAANGTENVAPAILSVPAQEKPGPLGLVVSGSSSGIKTDYFEQAAIDAINASGLFSSIDNSKAAEIIMPMIGAKGTFPGAELVSDAPYVLRIRVIRVDAPSFAIRMTVGMNAVWSLYRTADKATLMHEVIHSTYTGSAFEGGFIGANRARAGTEGAARENIRIGVEFLEVVDFEQVALEFEQVALELEQE